MSLNVVNKTDGSLTQVAGTAGTAASRITFDDTSSSLGSSNVQGAIDNLTTIVNTKQAATDNTLTTTAKTVSGAINELKSGLTNHENKNNVVIGWDNRNLWDEQGEQGIYNTETGEKGTGNNFRCKNYIPCEPETNYYMVKPNIGCYVLFYTSTKQFIRSISLNADAHVITTPENAKYITFYMFLAYGTTYNNDISFNADNTDTVYHKYHPSIGDSLTELDVALSVPENTGKNVLPTTLEWLKARNTVGTWDGNVYTKDSVTFTVATDSKGRISSITVNGTASGANTIITLAAGRYDEWSGMILNGAPTNNSDYYIRLEKDGSPYTAYAINIGGDTTISSEIVGNDIKIFIKVGQGKTANNAVFTPMIRDSRITDPTYAPYIPSVESRIEAVESGLTNVTPDIKTITASPDVNGFINLSTYGYSKNSHKYVNAVVVDNNYNIKMWKHSSYGWVVTLYTAETFTRVTDPTVSVDLVVFGIKA